MASKDWTFRLEDAEHTVHVDHNYWSGKRTVLVDGNVVVNETKFLDLISDYPFDVSGHRGLLAIRTNGLTYNYDFAIDGKSVTTGRPVVQAEPMPTWGWLFVVACLIIPIVSLCGAIPIIIGGTGAVLCGIVARNASREPGMRIAICLGITVLAWAAYIGFILFWAGLFPIG
jgi:hypothetical protein